MTGFVTLSTSIRWRSMSLYASIDIKFKIVNGLWCIFLLIIVNTSEHSVFRGQWQKQIFPELHGPHVELLDTKAGKKYICDWLSVSSPWR